tara:strand:- start:14 stop:361 length:348 start_codon:yes stop_codon:yes gene_type:complete
VPETKPPSTLIAIKGRAFLATFKATKTIKIAPVHTTYVLLMCRKLIMLSDTWRAGTNCIVAFEVVGVFTTEEPRAVLTGVSRRTSTPTNASPKLTPLINHEITVPVPAKASQWRK